MANSVAPDEVTHYELPHLDLLYFFSYKVEFFFLTIDPKNLDPSYWTDLDL